MAEREDDQKRSDSANNVKGLHADPPPGSSDNGDPTDNESETASTGGTNNEITVFLGLILTAALVAAGISQCSSSQRQADIADESKNLQFRPIISFEGITLKIAGAQPDNGQPLWAFMPHIKNVGSIPTEGMFCRYGSTLDIVLDGKPIKDPASHLWGNLTNEKRIQTLAPGLGLDGFGWVLPGRNVNDVRDGETIVGFFGRCEYNNTRITEYCAVASIPHFDYERTTLNEVDVLPILCPEHNCADKDCANEEAARRVFEHKPLGKKAAP